ncbi:MAG: DUF4230 domain-containing protein [Treponema sp.]|nr:DUF4230 domain-containing protein [Treponema sp.]
MNLKKNTDAPKKAFWKKGAGTDGINATNTANAANVTPVRSRSHTALFIKIILCLILVIALLVAGFIVYLKFAHPNIENRRMLVDEQLSYCQELVTMKYRYSDIVTVKKSVSISTSYAIVKYNGIIRIGIADMSMVDYDVYNRGKSVRITIPAPEVLGNDIVSQSVFDEHRSIFVPLTIEEVFNEVDNARQEQLDAILQKEAVFEEAAEYAKKIITLSMKSCGFEEVIVVGGEH